jgi:hypothetical protein
LADKDNSRLLPRMRDLIEDPRAEWRGLDDRIAAFDAEFVRWARKDVAPASGDDPRDWNRQSHRIDGRDRQCGRLCPRPQQKSCSRSGQ